MKKEIIALLLMLFSLNSIAQNNLRVITYNIWNGFEWGKDSLRRAKFQAWVNTQKPDVFALQELCGYTPEKLAIEATNWGHSYTALLKTTGYSVGITSRFPIEIKEKIFDGLWHGALHAKINGIDFLVIHLNPGQINGRRAETKILLKKLETIKAETDKYIVLGDFNAHSPIDADFYEKDQTLIKRLSKGKPPIGNLEDGHLDFAVISSFLSFPLVDVVHRFTPNGIAQRGSFPTHALGPVNKETVEELEARLERIDFIMVSPTLARSCVDAKVLNKGATYFLSDHYPVLADFK